MPQNTLGWRLFTSALLPLLYMGRFKGVQSLYLVVQVSHGKDYQ